MVWDFFSGLLYAYTFRKQSPSLQANKTVQRNIICSATEDMNCKQNRKGGDKRIITIATEYQDDKWTETVCTFLHLSVCLTLSSSEPICWTVHTSSSDLGPTAMLSTSWNEHVSKYKQTLTTKQKLSSIHCFNSLLCKALLSLITLLLPVHIFTHDT